VSIQIQVSRSFQVVALDINKLEKNKFGESDKFELERHMSAGCRYFSLHSCSASLEPVWRRPGELDTKE